MGRAHEVRKAAMAKTAAKKTKLYSYYGKEIYLAAKAGGPEPDGNLSLRRLIEKAKKDQVPGDVIKRAIDKVKNGAVEDYESVQFEGFGPSGSTVIVKCLTDNINRTISQVRPAFTKSKAKLGAEGSVSYLYDVESVVQFKGMDEETPFRSQSGSPRRYCNHRKQPLIPCNIKGIYENSQKHFAVCFGVIVAVSSFCPRQ